MNTQNNTPASRNEEAVADSLQLCISDLRHSAIVDDAHDMLSCVLAVCNRLDALAALGAAIDAREQGDPTDPGRNVDVLREHVRHLERQLRQIHDASSGKAPAASAQPMFFASAEQANALEDRPEYPEHGRYLPVRKTAAGKFTMPLYTAPSEALSPATVAQPVKWEDGAEKYLADIISRSPEPLRQLGDWLATRLDEDDWKTAGRFVLGAMESIAQPCASQGCGGAVSDAMVDAYLKANDAYWKRTDELPRSGTKWRNGTPREATREGLVAALSTAKSGGGATPEGGGE